MANHRLIFLVLALGWVARAGATDAAAPVPAPAAAAPNPELRGLIATASEKRFDLALPNGGHSEWVAVGDKFGDWTVAEYRDKDGVLVLRRSGAADLDLSLAASHVEVGDARATLEDAQRVLLKMNLGPVLHEALDPQRKALLGLAARLAARNGLTDRSSPAYAAYEQKVEAAITAALDPKQAEADLAQIYSNVFTPDELSGLSGFFDSSVGQAYTTKAPEVQKQFLAVLVPRIQAVVPQLQSLASQAAPPAPAAPASGTAPAKP